MSNEPEVHSSLETAEGAEPWSDCVLIAELGPNPAPLVEMIWALGRQQKTRVSAAYLLYHHSCPHEPVWDELCAALRCLEQDCPELKVEGLRLLTCPLDLEREEPVELMVAQLSAETELEEPETRYAPSPPLNVTHEDQQRWRFYLQAIAHAEGLGPDCALICGLVGGRRRASAAMSVVFFQLLARRFDRCYDVRVSHREVEGARARFYYPEQSFPLYEQPFEASEVEVHLDELLLPRFYALLSEEERQSYLHALRGTHRWAQLPERPPQLSLATRTLKLQQLEVSLPPAQAFYLALVALFAAFDRSPGLPKRFKHLFKRCQEPAAASQLKLIYHELYSATKRGPSAWIEALAEGSYHEGLESSLTNSMRTERSRLTKQIDKHCAAREELLIDDHEAQVCRAAGLLRGLTILELEPNPEP